MSRDPKYVKLVVKSRVPKMTPVEFECIWGLSQASKIVSMPAGGQEERLCDYSLFIVLHYHHAPKHTIPTPLEMSFFQ